MNARDELADILHGKGAYCGSCGYEDGRCSDCKEVLTGYADAILAAGYSKPRQVSTVAELEGLPDGSVIRDKFNDVSERRAGYWCGYDTAPLSDQIVKKYLPAAVLYTPDAPTETGTQA